MTGSRSLVFCVCVGVADGLVTLDLDPNERVAWLERVAVARPPRRRVGGIFAIYVHYRMELLQKYSRSLQGTNVQGGEKDRVWGQTGTV